MKNKISTLAAVLVVTAGLGACSDSGDSAAKVSDAVKETPAAAVAAPAVADSGSAGIAKLESLLSKAETDFSDCGSKAAAEMAACAPALVQELSAQWSANIQAAAEEDPEAVTALTERFTAINTGLSEKLAAAFQ